MLPSLSDKLDPQRRPLLVLSSIALTQQHALQELKKVHAIQVSYASKNDRYVLDVYVDDLPASTSPGSAAPTVQDGDDPRRRIHRLEKRLSEFVELHDKVYNIVHFAHRADQCELCSKTLDVIVFGPNPGSLLLHFLSHKRVARQLSRFVEALRVATVQHTTRDTRGGCSGQANLAHVVYAFLFSPSPDTV